jgi:broad specificity phosphatase PhoE
MPSLYLIRHPATQPDPAIPASAWPLSDEGRTQVQALLKAPFWRGVTGIFTSDQPKATAVGEAVQAAWNIPFEVIADLAEAQRDRWLGWEAFDQAQQAFFAHPADPLVPGWESADAARARFTAAINSILAAHPAGDSLAVVTHGTVLTLYIAGLQGVAPTYDFWQNIGFASVMAVDRATMRPVTGFLTAPYEA